MLLLCLEPVTQTLQVSLSILLALFEIFRKLLHFFILHLSKTFQSTVHLLFLVILLSDLLQKSLLQFLKQKTDQTTNSAIEVFINVPVFSLRPFSISPPTPLASIPSSSFAVPPASPTSAAAALVWL